MFVTQMLVPSKATPVGPFPTLNVALGAWFAGNHFSSATFSGFTPTTPAGLPAVACVVPSGNVSAPDAPLIFRGPATSNCAPGVAVPMPTWPPARTNWLPAARPLTGTLSVPLSVPPASCR